MAYVIADDTDMALIPKLQTSHLLQLARSLRVAPLHNTDVPWTSEKISAQLPAYGKEIAQALNKCTKNQLFILEFTPSMDEEFLPMHRCWVPHSSGIDIPWELAYSENGQPLFLDSRISIAYYVKLPE